MSITLPKLPHPVMNAMLGDDWADLFTADQLRARDLEIVRVVLEAAVKASSLVAAQVPINKRGVECVEAIRGLEFKHHE